MAEKKHKVSKIRFSIELDEKNVPVNIEWKASDSENNESKKAKSISINLWDPKEKNTLSISIWTPEMLIDEMNTHFLQSLLFIAENYVRATKNAYVLEDMKKFCNELAKKIVANTKPNKN